MESDDRQNLNSATPAAERDALISPVCNPVPSASPKDLDDLLAEMGEIIEAEDGIFTP